MAKRETMTISLPPEMREWIDTLVAAGGYASASEYIREAVRGDQARRLRERITTELQETIAENDAKELDADEWASIREEIRERLARRNLKKSA